MSDERLRVAMAGLALAGLGVAGYLTYVHYVGVSPVCAVAHGCEKVQTSHWSKLAGVPVAPLGLLGYATILAALAIDGERGRLTAATTALIGFGFSAYLTYLEVIEIDAICPWCVTSAVIMTALAGLAIVRVLRLEPVPEVTPR